MKSKKAIISFLLIILLLFACSTDSNFDIDENEIDQVKISYFEDFGFLNEDFHRTIEKEVEVKDFVYAISTAKRQPGSVDMPEADFNLHFISSNGDSEAFHLWISEAYATATIVKINETDIAYELTEKSRNKIKSMLR
ncbi:hypothetical protein AB4Y30_00360 [Ornithinibacillus sp. 4-3]|uniref:YhfM-like domain-containing protein n=1 Tax=Ornithinibacillus sp. 4-3 TaxID=3231488 RepID=A0AB39HRD3_9BACI